MLDSITWPIHIKDILKIKRNDFVSLYEPFIRQVSFKNIQKILDCWSNLWYIHYKCNYWHNHFTFFSCKSRFCNSCSKPQSDLRMNNLYSRIPRWISYHHLVFTIPQELRPFFKRHRATLSILNHIAEYSVKYRCNKSLNWSVWSISVIHTFGSTLNRNPHIHMVITHGVFSNKSHCFTNNWFFIPIKGIRATRTIFLISALEDWVVHNLHNNDLNKELSFLRSFKNFKNKSNNKSYYYVSISKERFWFETLLWYIWRYLKRPVISESRIISFDWDYVTFQYKDKRDNSIKSHTLPVLEFIWNLIQHIPNEHFHMIYYAWIFANRCKHKYISIINTLFPSRRFIVPIPKKYHVRLFLRTWVDPLKCYICWATMHKYCIFIPWYKPFFFGNSP